MLICYHGSIIGTITILIQIVIKCYDICHSVPQQSTLNGQKHIKSIQETENCRSNILEFHGIRARNCRDLSTTDRAVEQV